MPSSPDPRIDWSAVEQSPEFKELISARKRFVLPATIFYLVWYLGFILLTGYAPDFMSESVYQGLTVGYCLALTQFVVVAVLGIMYLRRSERVYDPLAAKVRAKALSTAAEPAAGPRARPGVTAR